MGPGLVEATIRGGFDPAVWSSKQQEAGKRDFDQTLTVISGQSDMYKTLLGGMADADFLAPIEMFGNRTTKGAFIVSLVLCGHAAYRTQLFLYLKACGREELSTMNLWAGVDAPAPVA
jgi:hypothetical protein